MDRGEKRKNTDSDNDEEAGESVPNPPQVNNRVIQEAFQGITRCSISIQI